MGKRLATKDNIRVVVVDDSQTVRALLVSILQGAGNIQVIGTAVDGEDAVRLAKRLKPDVITMDINLPKMSGLDATRQIMREIPTPIVVVSGSLMRTDVDLTFEALEAGALTVVRTPGLADTKMCNRVIQAVRLMSEVPVVRRWDKTKKVVSTSGRSERIQHFSPEADLGHGIQVIGIASSTGGPGTLATVLRELPADYPIPILIVQHITKGFGAGLADWLNGETELRVRLARHGDVVQGGDALLAPDDYHMQINAQGMIELRRGTLYRGLRPSANYLFDSLADNYGPRAMGIVLTGMGDDGADGLVKLYQAGGTTIAQDKESCVVYGMPKEAVARNAIGQVLTPSNIAWALGQYPKLTEKTTKTKAM